MVTKVQEANTREQALFTYLYERQNSAVKAAERHLDVSQSRVKQLREEQRREEWLMESDSLGIAASREDMRGRRAFRRALERSIKEFVGDMQQLTKPDFMVRTGSDAIGMVYRYYSTSENLRLHHRALSKQLKIAYHQYVKGEEEQIKIAIDSGDAGLTQTLQKNLIAAKDNQRKLYLFGIVRS